MITVDKAFNNWVNIHEKSTYLNLFLCSDRHLHLIGIIHRIIPLGGSINVQTSGRDYSLLSKFHFQIFQIHLLEKKESLYMW